MESFETQWRRVSHIRRNAVSIAVRFASPEDASPAPAILIPGWLENSEMLKEIARALVERGVAVYAADTTASANMAIASELTRLPLPALELRKASMVHALMQEHALGRAHLLAHSEGALAALAVACARPEEIGSVVLANPAGCIGKTGLWSLCKNYALEMALHGSALAREAEGAEPFRPAELRRGAYDVFQGVRTLLSHPLESLRSVRAIAQSDAVPLIEFLRVKGNSVHILAGDEDRLVPLEKLRASVSAHADLTVVPHASHVWQLLEPERFGKLASEIISKEILHTAAQDAVLRAR